MQVLLLQDVRKLGHLGDVVDVKIGYARNYLIPQLLATTPTEDNISAIAEAKKQAALARTQRDNEFRKLVDNLVDVSVTIEAAANPEGTLYGSVAEKEIAAALQELGHPIKEAHVVLDAPIRTLDNRTVKIEFTEDITTDVKVWVVRDGESPDGEDDGTESEEEREEPEDSYDDE